LTSRRAKDPRFPFRKKNWRYCKSALDTRNKLPIFRSKSKSDLEIVTAKLAVTRLNWIRQEWGRELESNLLKQVAKASDDQISIVSHTIDYTYSRLLKFGK